MAAPAEETIDKLLTNVGSSGHFASRIGPDCKCRQRLAPRRLLPGTRKHQRSCRLALRRLCARRLVRATGGVSKTRRLREFAILDDVCPERRGGPFQGSSGPIPGGLVDRGGACLIDKIRLITPALPLRGALACASLDGVFSAGKRVCVGSLRLRCAAAHGSFPPARHEPTPRCCGQPINA